MSDLVSKILETWPCARELLKASTMIDPTDQEIKAIMLASGPAGEYIEKEIKKTDMATWSENEWYSFLEVVVTGFQDGMVSFENPHR